MWWIPLVTKSFRSGLNPPDRIPSNLMEVAPESRTFPVDRFILSRPCRISSSAREEVPCMHAPTFCMQQQISCSEPSSCGSDVIRERHPLPALYLIPIREVERASKRPIESLLSSGDRRMGAGKYS
ncbi:hypothetical protein OIU78_012978 [Salix suchowensis]|nr:hypothetical protein OIU78_012978 [Salix suchowensis]